MNNRLYIAEHNSRASEGKHGYFLAMNKHGDLLANELPSVNFMGSMDSLRASWSHESATFFTGSFIGVTKGFDVPDKVIAVW